MNPIKRLESRTIVIAQSDIDTDQILPARFLTATRDDGYADLAFADWRFLADDTPRSDSPLTGIDFEAHRILVAGNNFGCGSSREHAAWALRDLGIRAVISTGLADIFRANSLKNGLAAIEIDTETWRRLVASPGGKLVVDLEACELTEPDGRASPFEIDRFGRHCLLEGVDQLGFLLSLDERISAFEQSRRSLSDPS